MTGADQDRAPHPLVQPNHVTAGGRLIKYLRPFSLQATSVGPCMYPSDLRAARPAMPVSSLHLIFMKNKIVIVDDCSKLPFFYPYTCVCVSPGSQRCRVGVGAGSKPATCFLSCGGCLEGASYRRLHPPTLPLPPPSAFPVLFTNQALFYVS